MLSTGQLLGVTLPSHSWVADMSVLLCAIVTGAELVTILYLLCVLCTVYCTILYCVLCTVCCRAAHRALGVSKHHPGSQVAGQHWEMDHFSCCHLNFMVWKLRYNTEMLHLNFIKGVCECFIVFHPAWDTWTHNTGCFYEELYSDFYLSPTKGLPSWRGAINSILFTNAVCEAGQARPGARAEAGTMSSLENYKWVYLAFQRPPACDQNKQIRV